jgi:hypothetical protein
MLDAFYGAFSPACLALLGLWLVVVQLRLPQWQASEAAPAYQRASYGIALHFALPALMSLLALVDSGDPAYWRTSFEIIALGGVVVLCTLRGLPGQHRQPGRPGTGRGAGRAAGSPLGGGLGLAAFVVAIAAYLAVGALAFVGGPTVLRVEAILLTGLVFLGFNAAWLLLFDSGPDSRPTAAPAQSTGPAGAESAANSADIDATPTASGWAPDSQSE